MPPHKAVIEEHARRIVEAVQALEAACAERDVAMADALKAGASVREVAAAAGTGVTQAQKIGEDNGWPTAAQHRQWNEANAEREKWELLVQQYRETGGLPMAGDGHATWAQGSTAVT